MPLFDYGKDHNGDVAGGHLTIDTAMLKMEIDRGAVIYLKDNITNEVHIDTTYASANFPGYEASFINWCGDGQGGSRACSNSNVSGNQVDTYTYTLTYTLLSDVDNTEYIMTFVVDSVTGEVLISQEGSEPEYHPIQINMPFIDFALGYGGRSVIGSDGWQRFPNNSDGGGYGTFINSHNFVCVGQGQNGVVGIWSETTRVGIYNERIHFWHQSGYDHLVCNADQVDTISNDNPHKIYEGPWRITCKTNWVEVARRWRSRYETVYGAQKLWENDCTWVRNIHCMRFDYSYSPNTTILANVAAVDYVTSDNLVYFNWNMDREPFSSDNQMDIDFAPDQTTLALIKDAPPNGYGWKFIDGFAWTQMEADVIKTTASDLSITVSQSDGVTTYTLGTGTWDGTYGLNLNNPPLDLFFSDFPDSGNNGFKEVIYPGGINGNAITFVSGGETNGTFSPVSFRTQSGWEWRWHTYDNLHPSGYYFQPDYPGFISDDNVDLYQRSVNNESAFATWRSGSIAWLVSSTGSYAIIHPASDKGREYMLQRWGSRSLPYASGGRWADGSYCDILGSTGTHGFTANFNDMGYEEGCVDLVKRMRAAYPNKVHVPETSDNNVALSALCPFSWEGSYSFLNINHPLRAALKASYYWHKTYHVSMQIKYNVLVGALPRIILENQESGGVTTTPEWAAWGCAEVSLYCKFELFHDLPSAWVDSGSYTTLAYFRSRTGNMFRFEDRGSDVYAYVEEHPSYAPDGYDRLVISNGGIQTNNIDEVLPASSPVYSRYWYASLPPTDDNLTTLYTSQDYLDVAIADEVRVSQSAYSGQYALHEYKNFIVGEGAAPVWRGRTNVSGAASTIYLKVLNHTTDLWETLDSNDSVDADTDFTLTGIIPDTTNYINNSGQISCWIYQYLA